MVIENTAGGAGGVGSHTATGSSSWAPGANGGNGWVRLYLNEPGNEIANERCIYP